jgi:uncharacterized membrane protein SpoIIM required for sporulation/uncharacterized RDD family membrane protein YckC
MSAPGAPAPLSTTVDVETPELVVFSYTVAGIGSRVLAAFLDYLLCALIFLLLLLGFGALGALGALGWLPGVARSEVWVLAFFVIVQFAILWGYYVLWEGLADGQTPGKRRLRLRVVSDGGYSVTFGASAVRNLVRIVDMQPIITYGVGIASAVASRQGKRLGDLVAGTIVVREQIVEQPAPVAATPAPTTGSDSAPEDRHARLTDDEFAVLHQFVERRTSLAPDRREALATQLAARFATLLEMMDGGTEQRLVALHAAERTARARGAVAVRETGAARERHAIVAAGSPRWAAFSARLAQAQRRGLASLGEDGVRTFVAEYRDVAADLARLRTAARGRERGEIFYLSRLMAGAHNLLYRGKTLTIADVIRTIAIDAPREVRRSAVPIGLAVLLLFGPAVIAYTAVVRDPSTARTFIPPAMLDRAEDGVRRAREGEGYITDPQLFRPVMASSIIANNVQVTFAVFAFGVTAGLGSTLVLVQNGVSLGGIFGLYASKGIASLLLAFVAPHGVLELTAICIAGGAGFLIAAALLVPGQRTRRRALVENGRRAIRLVAASTTLLLVAGTIEGFVSPIEWWPLDLKLIVSAATAVLLVVYLRGGRTTARRVP